MEVLALLWTNQPQEQPTEQQKEQNLQPIPQGQAAKSATPVTKSAGQRVTLDFANPDESKIKIETENYSGVEYTTYSPKSGSKITSVVENDKQVWKAGAGKECLFVESYEKGNITIICLETSDGSGTTFQFFEKVDEAWKNITEDDYDKKIDAMMGESGKDVSLNISHPSRLLYKSFDYTFAGNAVQLIVPENVTVKKLMNGNETVWIPSTGETFQYAKVYLNKDGKPELILVTLKTSSGILRKDYVKDGNGWTVCTNTDVKIKNLVVISNWVSDFELDLSLETSTDQCTIFETDLLGLTTKHFYPKPGLVATQVKDGGKELWTPMNASDVCLYCLIYRKGTVEILEMIVVERLTRRWKYFEKNGTEWKSIVKTEYNKKLNEMSKSGS